MFERFTIESEPPQHYCHACAESVPAVITALQLAYDQELLIILHDDQVTDEICAYCQRPIATVLAPPGLYQAEVTLTIQCRVSLTARSAPQAYYSLRYLLDTQHFERALAEVEEALAGVRGVEEVSADDCFYEVETAVRIPGEEEALEEEHRCKTQGYAWRRALPSGYELSLLGAFVFGVGGVLDLTWHLLFGIERNVDALLSPTHLILALGVILTVSGPLRSAWRRPLPEQAESLMQLLPAILSLAYILASIQLQSAIFMGGALFALRRWHLPFGTFALLFTINSLVGSILATDIPPLLLVALVSAITGLLVDLLSKALKPWPEREPAFRLFALLTPLLIQGTYFLTLFALKGVAWSVDLWMGSIVVAGIAGLLLSYLLVPPQIPTRQSP